MIVKTVLRIRFSLEIYVRAAAKKINEAIKRTRKIRVAHGSKDNACETLSEDISAGTSGPPRGSNWISPIIISPIIGNWIKFGLKQRTPFFKLLIIQTDAINPLAAARSPIAALSTAPYNNVAAHGIINNEL